MNQPSCCRVCAKPLSPRETVSYGSVCEDCFVGDHPATKVSRTADRLPVFLKKCQRRKGEKSQSD